MIISLSLLKDIISREEYQVKKLMEGLNKSKAPPAETEKEEKDASKEINQHMPKYIVQAPCKISSSYVVDAFRVSESKRAKLGTSKSTRRQVKDWN